MNLLINATRLLSSNVTRNEPELSEGSVALSGAGCSGAQVWAEVMGAEAALVRVQLVSGTHAISTALAAVLRPGDELLAVAGRQCSGAERPSKHESNLWVREHASRLELLAAQHLACSGPQYSIWSPGCRPMATGSC